MRSLPEMRMQCFFFVNTVSQAGLTKFNFPQIQCVHLPQYGITENTQVYGHLGDFRTHSNTSAYMEDFRASQ